jgi:hypothetical protein
MAFGLRLVGEPGFDSVEKGKPLHRGYEGVLYLDDMSAEARRAER